MYNFYTEEPEPIIEARKILRAPGKTILAYDMYFGEQTTSTGIILMDDDKTDRGIHPRWARIFTIGGQNIREKNLKPGYWILVKHGRWTRGIDLHNFDASFEPYKHFLRKIDPDDILLYTEINPNPEIGNMIGPF